MKDTVALEDIRLAAVLFGNLLNPSAAFDDGRKLDPIGNADAPFRVECLWSGEILSADLAWSRGTAVGVSFRRH
jgi:hypothetical protein